jgi:hypothetical protein
LVFMDGGFLRVRFFVVTSPLPLLAEEPPSTHLSFNGHRGASLCVGFEDCSLPRL